MDTGWKERGDRVLMNTYGRFPATMVKGEGCRLYDDSGREYLDFVAGIAVCNLGHCHPEVNKAISEQLERLVHVSNLYHTTPQIELAELLLANCKADRVFFCNSGAEANEAAIKLARKYSPPGRYEVISLSGSFHGRTLATVAATGQAKFHQGFEPMPAGFVHAPFADLEALEAMVGPATCAILCEPLQGEGGVRPLAPEYLRGISEICKRHGLLLIFDEVQVGMGRCGSLLAHEQYQVFPDIFTMAKGLANGLPIGAMLAREEVAAAFVPGSHASTFGGNPVACAAALACLKTVLSPGFLDQVQSKGEYLAAGLKRLVEKYPEKAVAVRGMGLIQGLVLSESACKQGLEMVQELFKRGLLLNFAGNSALRYIPPLVVSQAEIDQALALTETVLQK